MTLDVACVRAANPGLLTLTGTNTYVVGRDPCWVVDPGPDLADHIEAVVTEVERRGGAAAIVITHSHSDHVGAAGAVAGRVAAPLHAAAVDGAAVIGDGDRIGPLVAIATPGHAPDHLAFVADDLCFTGDAILGTGSVFLAPDPGSLSAYLAALERLRAMPLTRLYPGHGPVVEDPGAHIDGYIAHRRDREQRLVAALDAGGRTVDELLDSAWSDAPSALRPAAALSLRTHLDHLAEQGRVPDDVEWPAVPDWARAME